MSGGHLEDLKTISKKIPTIDLSDLKVRQFILNNAIKYYQPDIVTWVESISKIIPKEIAENVRLPLYIDDHQPIYIYNHHIQDNLGRFIDLKYPSFEHCGDDALSIEFLFEYTLKRFEPKIVIDDYLDTIDGWGIGLEGKYRSTLREILYRKCQKYDIELDPIYYDYNFLLDIFDSYDDIFYAYHQCMIHNVKIKDSIWNDKILLFLDAIQKVLNKFYSF